MISLIFFVPLSDQALEVVKSAWFGLMAEKYVFCWPRNNNKPIHFNTPELDYQKNGIY